MAQYQEQIKASSDDCHETNLGAVITNINPAPNSGIIPYTAFRFLNVTIPQGATIISAILTIGLYGASCVASPYCNIDFYGADEDNVATWSSGNKPSTRIPTDATTVFQRTGSQTSPISGCASVDVDINVTSIVQEIINRDNWSSSNALGIIGKSISWCRACSVEWDTFDNAPECSARLTINYEVAGVPKSVGYIF